MYQVIIVIHVLLGLCIIGLIMMQHGKGADAGAAFGTGSSGSVFGAQGAASFLSRSTAVLATLFFITSLGLAVLNGKKGPAFDLMSPAAEETPVVGVSKSAEISPVVPEKSEDIPVTPEAAGKVSTGQGNIPTDVPEIKDTVVPKAEEIKTVEEKKNAAAKTTEGSAKK